MQEVVVLALSLHICLTEQPGFKSRGLYRIIDSQIHCIVFSPAPWLQYYQTETWPQNAWLVYQLPHWAIINHSRVLLGLWGKLKRSVPTQHLVAPWGTLQLPVCGVAASQQCHLWHAGTVRCMWHARRPGLCSCVSLCLRVIKGLYGTTQRVCILFQSDGQTVCKRLTVQLQPLFSRIFMPSCSCHNRKRMSDGEPLPKAGVCSHHHLTRTTSNQVG